MDMRVLYCAVLLVASIAGNPLQCNIESADAPTNQAPNHFIYEVCQRGITPCTRYQVQDDQSRAGEFIGAPFGCDLDDGCGGANAKLSNDALNNVMGDDLFLEANEYIKFDIQLGSEAQALLVLDNDGDRLTDNGDGTVSVEWGAVQEDTDTRPFPFMCTHGTYGFKDFFDINLRCSMNLCARICSSPQWDTTDPGSIWQAAGYSRVNAGDDSCLQKDDPLIVGEQNDFVLAMSNPGGGKHVINVVGSATQVEEVALTNDIEAAVDGGIPIGMTFDNQVTVSDKKSTREVMWTPRKGQQGQTFLAFFVAGSFPADENDLYKCPIRTTFLNVSISVARPEVGWVETSLEFDRTVVVGESDTVSMQCTPDSDSSAKIELVSVSENGVAATGMLGATHQITPATPGKGANVLLELSFEPVVGDEGSNKTWCYSCGDSLDVEPRNVRCITWTTELCKVYSSEGDTLQALTRKFHLDRNWRRLWNVNPWLSNPYVALMEDTTVNLGTLYRVRHSDTLQTIAGLFETTVKRLLMVNPHIEKLMDDELPKDVDLCILPCTNQRPPSILGGVPSH